LTLQESLHQKLKIDDSISTHSCAGRIESSSKDMILNVGFNLVNIREYPITLGENPGVSGGPSLTIDWEPQAEVKLPLERYESTRPPRRNYVEMSIPKNVRMKMLQTNGHTKKEILASVKRTNISRINRKKTVAMMHLHDSQEAFEDCKRGFRHIVTFKKHKKKERALLDLSDQFQRQRAIEAIQAENEAAAEEVRMMKEIEKVSAEIEKKKNIEVKGFPTTQISSDEKEHLASVCSDDMQKDENMVIELKHSITQDSVSNSPLCLSKPIISCEES